MSKQTYLDLIDQAIEELHNLRADIEDGLVPRIRDSWNGHPRSPSFEAGSSPRRPDTDLADELRGDIDYADPVGRVVAATGARDAAAQDAKTLGHAITTIAAQARRAGDVRRRHKRRPAAMFDREQTQEAEPGCVSCARVDSPGTVGMAKSARTPLWNPVAREVTLADGSKAALCEWCRVQARTTGSLPDKAEVEAHRDGVRVKRRSA